MTVLPLPSTFKISSTWSPRVPEPRLMRMRLEHDLYIHPGRGNGRSDPSRDDERCWEVYQIQLEGLVKQPQATGIQRFVIGISGGVDSTLYGLLVVRRVWTSSAIPAVIPWPTRCQGSRPPRVHSSRLAALWSP